jgi:hypothetical protein
MIHCFRCCEVRGVPEELRPAVCKLISAVSCYLLFRFSFSGNVLATLIENSKDAERKLFALEALSASFRSRNFL